jgi:hypothetical protein
MPLPKLKLSVPQEGYSFDDGDAVLRAKLSSGPSRTRLDMLDAPIECNIQLVLSADEYQYWTAFKRTTIARASMPFLIDLVVDSAEIAEYQVLIIPGTLKTNIQGTAHIVSMGVEMVATVADPATDVALLMIYELYGSRGADFLNRLEQFANFQLPMTLP